MIWTGMARTIRGQISTKRLRSEAFDYITALTPFYFKASKEAQPDILWETITSHSDFLILF